MGQHISHHQSQSKTTQCVQQRKVLMSAAASTSGVRAVCSPGRSAMHAAPTETGCTAAHVRNGRARSDATAPPHGRYAGLRSEPLLAHRAPHLSKVRSLPTRGTTALCKPLHNPRGFYLTLAAPSSQHGQPWSLRGQLGGLGGRCALEGWRAQLLHVRAEGLLEHVRDGQHHRDSHDHNAPDECGSHPRTTPCRDRCRR